LNPIGFKSRIGSRQPKHFRFRFVAGKLPRLIMDESAINTRPNPSTDVEN